jgi:hypothetical protein
VRFTVAVVAVVGLGCGSESSNRLPGIEPSKIVVDAAIPPAPVANAPCIVKVELAPGRITISGGGLGGSDLTALRSVATKCVARVLPNDDVPFEEVTKAVGLIVQQGIEVRLGAPVGQWMSMDLARITKLWKVEPTSTLITAVNESGPRLGSSNTSIVEQVTSALAAARQSEPIGTQTADRGLFEAIAQIVGLRRATAPVAIDVLERSVMPVLRVDLSRPVEDGTDTQLELFELFVTRASKRSAQQGLLGVVPDAALSTPYPDGTPISVADGDFTLVATAPLVAQLDRYDEVKLGAKYDDFVKRVKRRDGDRVLFEIATRALADLRECVNTALLNREQLLFRVLPPPTVKLSGADAGLPTVVITKTAVSVDGKAASQVMVSAAAQLGPTFVIEADRSLRYGRIRTGLAAIGPFGVQAVVLRPR